MLYQLSGFIFNWIKFDCTTNFGSNQTNAPFIIKGTMEHTKLTWNRPMFVEILFNGFLTIREILYGLPRRQ